MKIDSKKLRTHAEAILALCDAAEQGAEQEETASAAPEDDGEADLGPARMKLKLSKYKGG